MKKTLLVFLVLLAALFGLAARQVITNPLIRGDADGVRFEWVFRLATDLTADTWILGDTTTAGMFVPEQAVEITDIAIFGDPDSGDSCRVIIYSANTGAGSGVEIAATSGWHVGTTWAMTDDCTPVTAYKVITPAEGLAVLFDFRAGTPNAVTVVISGKYRIKETRE